MRFTHHTEGERSLASQSPYRSHDCYYTVLIQALPTTQNYGRVEINECRKRGFYTQVCYFVDSNVSLNDNLL